MSDAGKRSKRSAARSKRSPLAVRVKPVFSETEQLWILRTSMGFIAGDRLITKSPEPGRSLPPDQVKYASRQDADRAAMRWNLYLMNVQR